jgi:RNA polymerase sigma factor (sigma-70 family)
MTTEDLLRACVRGEDPAWRLFLERYGDLISSVPLTMGATRADAEEIFQNTVPAIVERLGTLRDPARIVAWICEIARRQTLYDFRKRRREALGEDDALISEPDPTAGSDALLESLQAGQLIKNSLLSIQSRCRDLSKSLYLDDPTPAYKEIAASLGIPIGSIGPTRARCLKALREALASPVIATRAGPMYQAARVRYFFGERTPRTRTR